MIVLSPWHLENNNLVMITRKEMVLKKKSETLTYLILVSVFARAIESAYMCVPEHLCFVCVLYLHRKMKA